MIFKILKEYIRRVSRNYKIYAISILGMSIAIIASFHMYHFVFKELSVDGFHEKREHIYRVLHAPPSLSHRSVQTAPPLGKYLKDNLPEVSDYTRIIPSTIINLAIEGQKVEEDALSTDTSFFEMFNFKLKKGSLEAFKDNINSVILSERKALQIFGDKEAIGQSIEVYKSSSKEIEKREVVGIIANIPENSTLQSDVFLNIKSNGLVSYTDNNEKAGWRTGFTHLYLYLPNISSSKKISHKITDLLYERLKSNGIKEVDKKNYKYNLQRLDTIYFDSFDITNQVKKGSLQFVSILIVISLLTLLLAVFNYILMNLGLKLNRANELKIRRYLGVSKLGVFMSFLFESVFNVLVCFTLALITYPILSPLIKELIGFDYQLTVLHDKSLLFLYFLVVLTIGFIAGTLEFFLSYKTIFSTKTTIKWTSSWFSKKIIIGFQLSLFIGLIICFLFISKQVNYIQTQDLGFDKNVVTINSSGFDEVLINELRSKSYVKNITAGDMIYSPLFNLEDVDVKSSQSQLKAMVIKGAPNYLDTYGLNLLEGRNIKSTNKPKLSNSFSVGWSPTNSDDLIEVLVNEKFVEKTNLKKPIGTFFKSASINNGVIVGVFKDIHNTPLYNPIHPIVIGFGFNNFPIQSLHISYNENSKDEIEKFLEELYLKKGLTYFERIKDNMLYKVDFNDVYKKELQLKRLLEAFTFIVLFISLLGLVAISLFITESKTKEIGIRKVNGATIKEIMLMLNKDFIKWVLIAFVIACPIAYYAMSKWLENFAYKTTLSWWVFALAGLFTLVIALLTVSWQTYRAATQNPVESLRDE